MGYPSQPLELPRDSTIRLLIRISHKTRLKLRPEETMKRSGAVRGMLGVISRQLGYRAVPVQPVARTTINRAVEEGLQSRLESCPCRPKQTKQCLPVVQTCKAAKYRIAIIGGGSLSARLKQ